MDRTFWMILLTDGIITFKQIASALFYQSSHDGPIVEALVKLGYISSDTLDHYLEIHKEYRKES